MTHIPSSAGPAPVTTTPLERIHTIDDALPAGQSCVHWIIGYLLALTPEIVTEAIDEYEKARA